MASTNEILFKEVQRAGEGIHGPLHIIKQTGTRGTRTDYRVYHAKGYCFDVCKSYIDSDTPILNPYCYSFFAGYDDFKPLTAKEAIKLFINIQK